MRCSKASQTLGDNGNTQPDSFFSACSSATDGPRFLRTAAMTSLLRCPLLHSIIRRSSASSSEDEAAGFGATLALNLSATIPKSSRVTGSSMLMQMRIWAHLSSVVKTQAPPMGVPGAACGAGGRCSGRAASLSSFSSGET